MAAIASAIVLVVNHTINNDNVFLQDDILLNNRGGSDFSVTDPSFMQRPPKVHALVSQLQRLKQL
jgi:hypothetical protein